MAISASTNQLLLSENVFLILQEPLTFTAQFALSLHLWQKHFSRSLGACCRGETFFVYFAFKDRSTVWILQGDGALTVYTGPQQQVWCEQDAQQAQEPC